MKNQLVVQCNNARATGLSSMAHAARRASNPTTIAPNSCRAMHKALSHAGCRNVECAQIEFPKSHFAKILPWSVMRPATGCLTKWRMKMTTIADRRREVDNTISRLTAQREAIIANLIRNDTKLKVANLKLRRLKRAAANALALEAAKHSQGLPLPKPKVEEVTDIPVSECPIADDLAIPTFLQRKKEAERKDSEAAAEILAVQAARKRTKAQVRIEKMKAKQAGETRRMPLTGRAALDAIRNG